MINKDIGGEKTPTSFSVLTNAPEGKLIAILGAGCAGLAAASRLIARGYSVVLLERADHAGGLAGGVHINGNTYEYGPHTFHTTDPEMLREIRLLMGSELIEYGRTIKIKFMGEYFKFPLAIGDILFKLPFTTVVHAGLSFLWHFTVGRLRKPPVETSETLLKRYYGNVLYELFFKTYVTSVWGISPAEFSPSFARQRIPRMDIFSIVDKLRSAAKRRLHSVTNTDDYVEKVEGDLFTTKQGFSRITQRMADEVVKRGGKLELNAEVSKIARAGDRARCIEFVQNGTPRQIECSGVINTLALNEAILMMDPPLAAPVIASARALRFRALVFVGLLVRRQTVLPSSFMYFRQHSFNRISDLAQFGFEIVPQGCTMLVAEMSCDVTDRPWNDDEYAKHAVLDDLIAEGLLTRTEVVEIHVFRARHAYPIYTLDYEKHLGLLLHTVNEMTNVETAGRQGRFAYVNTHIAMKMGYEAADRLVAKME